MAQPRKLSRRNGSFHFFTSCAAGKGRSDLTRNILSVHQGELEAVQIGSFAGHARAGNGGPRLFIGHPRFEGFEAIQTTLPAGARAA